MESDKLLSENFMTFLSPTKFKYTRMVPSISRFEELCVTHISHDLYYVPKR